MALIAGVGVYTGLVVALAPQTVRLFCVHRALVAATLLTFGVVVGTQTGGYGRVKETSPMGWLESRSDHIDGMKGTCAYPKYIKLRIHTQ